MGSSRIALMILFSVLTLTGCSSCGKVDGTKPSGQNEAKRTGNEPKEEPGPKTDSKGKPGPKLDLKYLPADAFAAEVPQPPRFPTAIT